MMYVETIIPLGTVSEFAERNPKIFGSGNRN